MKELYATLEDYELVIDGESYWIDFSISGYEHYHSGDYHNPPECFIENINIIIDRIQKHNENNNDFFEVEINNKEIEAELYSIGEDILNEYGDQ